MPSLPASGEISFRTFILARGLQAVYTLDMAHAAYVYDVDTAGGISMDEFYNKDDIFFEYTGCGRGENPGQACNDATNNNRTFYSADAPPSFGVGSYVYTDQYPTALTGFTDIFMNSQNWEVGPYGDVTGVPAEGC